MRGIEMKQSMRGMAMALAMLLLVVCGAARVGAQSNYATLTGMVADKTGAVIPKATIVPSPMRPPA